jgi:hypothetical protein
MAGVCRRRSGGAGSRPGAARTEERRERHGAGVAWADEHIKHRRRPGGVRQRQAGVRSTPG